MSNYLPQVFIDSGHALLLVMVLFQGVSSHFFRRFFFALTCKVLLESTIFVVLHHVLVLITQHRISLGVSSRERQPQLVWMFSDVFKIWNENTYLLYFCIQ